MCIYSSRIKIVDILQLPYNVLQYLQFIAILTMLTTNTNLGLEVISSIKEFFKERVYDTIIPRLIKLAEAPSHGKTILDYDPRGKGTKAYLNLAKEVIERNGREQKEGAR